MRPIMLIIIIDLSASKLIHTFFNSRFGFVSINCATRCFVRFRSRERLMVLQFPLKSSAFGICSATLLHAGQGFANHHGTRSTLSRRHASQRRTSHSSGSRTHRSSRHSRRHRRRHPCRSAHHPAIKLMSDLATLFIHLRVHGTTTLRHRRLFRSLATL